MPKMTDRGNKLSEISSATMKIAFPHLGVKFRLMFNSSDGGFPTGHTVSHFVSKNRSTVPTTVNLRKF